jgi:hypothetical protein
MTTHVKVLGALYLALSAIGLLVASFLFLALISAASVVGVAADPDEAALAIPIIGIAGTWLVGFLVVLSIPGLIVGWGLLTFQSWARIVGIVLSVLNLINLPFGTLLGIYGLWVLLNRNTEPLFATSAAVAQ